MRIKDYWHFEVDVLAGFVVGVASAILAYVYAAQYSRADVLYKVMYL